MPHRSLNTSIDESMFVAFLAGDEKAREEFPITAEKYIWMIARYVSPDLVERDLIQDVVQQTWLLLLMKTESNFVTTRGSAGNYLRLIIRTAAQDVRAMYAPVGQKTRLYRNEDGHYVPQSPAISLDAPMQTDENEINDLYDVIPDTFDWVIEFESVDYLDWIINQAWSTSPDFVAPALEYIYYDGSSYSDVAQIFGVTPSTVTRRIENWRLVELVPLDVNS
jgi:DNA-directed RNA polymerase specialized sigma24 family protein